MHPAEKALTDLRDYFREAAALADRRVKEANTFEEAHARDIEHQSFTHACEMVGAYICSLPPADDRSAWARAIDLQKNRPE